MFQAEIYSYNIHQILLYLFINYKKVNMKITSTVTLSSRSCNTFLQSSNCVSISAGTIVYISEYLIRSFSMISFRVWLSLPITLWTSYEIKNNFSSFTQFLVSACAHVYTYICIYTCTYILCVRFPTMIMIWKSCFCDIRPNLTTSASRLTLRNTHLFNQMMLFNL